MLNTNISTEKKATNLAWLGRKYCIIEVTDRMLQHGSCKITHTHLSIIMTRYGNNINSSVNRTVTSHINPLPVQFKALLHGQKGCVFFSGHLNLRTAPETGLPSREKDHNN